MASERHGRWGKAITLRGLARDTGSDAIDVRPAVSCASAGNCVAAGNYTNRDVLDQGFVAVERNGRCLLWVGWSGKAVRGFSA